jgi:putative addiction module component (TIGR02574 family)
MKPLQLFRMPKALEEVTKEAMELPPRERLALASFLLESADAASDPETETAWESEIRDRIRAIDDGGATGIAYADVMQEAERRLAP